MKVGFRTLGGTDILRLEVVDRGESDAHVGESVGYYCPLCGQADETRQQIWHREGCEYAGEHGRSVYDDLEPDPAASIPELDPDHTIDLVAAGESHQDIGVHHSEVIAFRCACGNLDEDLFEVVHDETCSLAGHHGRRVSGGAGT